MFKFVLSYFSSLRYFGFDLFKLTATINIKLNLNYWYTYYKTF